MIHDSKNAISDEGTEFFNSAYQEVYSNLLARDLDDEINFIKNRILKHFENPKIMDFLLRSWKTFTKAVGRRLQYSRIRY